MIRTSNLEVKHRLKRCDQGNRFGVSVGECWKMMSRIRDFHLSLGGTGERVSHWRRLAECCCEVIKFRWTGVQMRRQPSADQQVEHTPNSAVKCSNRFTKRTWYTHYRRFTVTSNTQTTSVLSKRRPSIAQRKSAATLHQGIWKRKEPVDAQFSRWLLSRTLMRK